ncbi:MAG: hypothetical protein IJT01_09485 [Selenomonadaceae bacterium]|nr:hypothetical protein [Selenomonadaceae bacterium]
MRKKIFAALCAVAFLLGALPIHGIAKESAHLEDSDFSCRGIHLGDSGEKMLAAFGEPSFDKQVSVYGIGVVYYSFPKGMDVGVSVRKREVVDILIRDRDYQARAGVRYGATSYKIRTAYGEKGRTMLDGVIYYIYEHPEKPRERLLLEVDSENGSLLSFRITSLPLTDEEADRRAEEDDVSSDLSVLLAGEKEIDTSAMPEHGPVKIRGLEK